MGFEIVLTKINKMVGHYAVLLTILKILSIYYASKLFILQYYRILIKYRPLQYMQGVNETTMVGLTYSIGREANVNSEEFVVCGCLRYLSAPD